MDQSAIGRLPLTVLQDIQRRFDADHFALQRELLDRTRAFEAQEDGHHAD